MCLPTFDQNMRKLSPALAAFTLIAAPIQASVALHRQHQAMLEESLAALRAGNLKKACLTYKEAYDFSSLHGFDQFQPVIGSAKVQSLIHERNELRAKSNVLTNKSGKSVCSKAGMTWAKPILPTTYIQSTSSSVSSNIRSRCEKEWGTDYVMVKHCIDEQTAAARSLGY
jgi:hypothetical protein